MIILGFMARISLEENFNPDEFELPRGFTKKRRRSKKIGFKKGCCLLFFLIFLFILIVAAAAVIKTGIWEIPVLTKIFYQIPKPPRIVQANDDFFQKPLNFELNQEENYLSFNLTEQDLTSILRRHLTGENNLIFASNLQAAISDNQIEIFGLLLKPISANITIVFKPEIFDQKFDLNLIELKIGNLSLPPVIGEKLINYFFGGMLNQVGDLKIANINLKERQIKIFISGGKIHELVNNLIKQKPEKNY